MARAARRTIPIASRTSSMRIAAAPWNPVPSTRLEIKVAFQFQSAGSAIVQQRYLGWLDTGAPLCYLPASLRHQGLVFQSCGARSYGLNGAECEIVTTDATLFDDQGSAVGPLVMLAKLAVATANMSSVEPVLMGLEFLQYHAAILKIDLTAQPFGEITL
jgi:hypothetical protein